MVGESSGPFCPLSCGHLVLGISPRGPWWSLVSLVSTLVSRLSPWCPVVSPKCPLVSLRPLSLSPSARSSPPSPSLPPPLPVTFKAKTSVIRVCPGSLTLPLPLPLALPLALPLVGGILVAPLTGCALPPSPPPSSSCWLAPASWAVVPGVLGVLGVLQVPGSPLALVAGRAFPPLDRPAPLFPPPAPLLPLAPCLPFPLFPLWWLVVTQGAHA